MHFAPFAERKQKQQPISYGNCDFARDVWASCARTIQKYTNDEDDFQSIMEKLLGKLGAVARMIWLRRNNVVFEGDFSSPEAITRNAQSQLELFRKAEHSHRLNYV
jgi:hypothetical protein